ncbi:VacJ family lipoprotein [Thalassococcus sp. CAU 1522]|uniref:VacJ family lipoprotein n=1 Tax=Thalassococcus arenae TaxID=2851652 RepID=A0ABS6N4J6_9RHOB|nr:VacJ family lipoprotein [Thalassococcus arenae]MBV2358947.1 VacJ family lipoprotein [Thalassococcus arenae]
MRLRLATIALCCAALASGCSTPGPGQAPDGIWDPNEAANRRVHAFNRSVDERLFRGAGTGLTDAVPEGVMRNVSNFADTASLPQTVLNQVLQGRLGDATRNTLRFTINATLGFGGLADVAGDLGLPRDDSDFGETLHVWGLPEGAYLELPLLGPSTERDAVGMAVDFATNPLRAILSPESRRWTTAARIVDRVGERGQFSDTVDSLLYDSADSYAQLRLIYLQNRRFELGDESAGADAYIDPEALDTEGF